MPERHTTQTEEQLRLCPQPTTGDATTFVALAGLDGNEFYHRPGGRKLDRLRPPRSLGTNFTRGVEDARPEEKRTRTHRHLPQQDHRRRSPPGTRAGHLGRRDLGVQDSRTASPAPPRRPRTPASRRLRGHQRPRGDRAGGSPGRGGPGRDGDPLRADLASPPPPDLHVRLPPRRQRLSGRGGGAPRAREPVVLGRAAAVGSATGSYLRPVEMETAEQAGCRAPGRPGDAAWYARSSVNLPNAITSIRLALVPVFAWLHLTDQPFSAMVVFTVAAPSDGIAGLLARPFDQRTRVGAILDPIADKLLVATSLVLLVVSGTLPPWLFLTALLRDAAVGSLGLASRLKGRWLEVEP